MTPRAGAHAVNKARMAAAALAIFAALAPVACHTKSNGHGDPGKASASAEPPPLPPLSLKDDTAGALLTWIDDKGDFHVVEHVAEVPEASRETVRVVLADRKDGTGDSVYVADLRTKNADGSYPVKTMSRPAWDELGASKRKARLEALAPSATPPAAAPAGSAEGAPAVAQNGEVRAIIYGASWCGPCHQAEALLKSLGVKVTRFDIEENDAAEREMQEKLARAHRRGGSIPVIDVMGQLFVGFSEGALRAAVAKARAGASQATTL
ncbi:MAG TPA: glutaredoxin family protein [Polyangiaceae bacterium]|nr:glutaredoxin family protein [Polyangiaceae bacterium]